MSIENPSNNNDRVGKILSGDIEPDVRDGPTAEVILEEDKIQGLMQDLHATPYANLQHQGTNSNYDGTFYKTDNPHLLIIVENTTYKPPDKSGAFQNTILTRLFGEDNPFSLENLKKTYPTGIITPIPDISTP